MTNKIKLLLADNHGLVREALKLIIETDPDFKVVAEAADGIECMEQVRAKEPDIVVLALAMPKLNGFNTISQLRRRHPDTKIFVLTAATTPTVWQEALELGTNGIATKRISKQAVLAGLKAVYAGERYISDDIFPQVENFLNLDPRPKKRRGRRILSAREKQVSKLVAEGYRTKDIAEILELSDRTVSKHRDNLMIKLDVTSPAEITHYATDSGLTKVKLNEIE